MNQPESALFPARIGLGTWKMGESANTRQQELAGVIEALEQGYRLIDTAEMYGDGGAERIVGAAVRHFGAARRAQLFITSKVLPSNASRQGTVRACEASLARLGCSYLDLYLLHWRGAYPLAETLQAFDELRQQGLVRHFGVSNFDVEDLLEWRTAEAALGLDGAARAQVNQIYYCAGSRGAEYALLPWQREHGIVTMAYSPLGLGDLARHATLAGIGRERGASAAQIALAWVLRQPGVVAIPKSIHSGRLRENLAAGAIVLDADELTRIDAAFPAPRHRQPLASI